MKNNPAILLSLAASLAIAGLAATHLISVVAALGTIVFLMLIGLTVSETAPNHQ
ncbi:MAG: hypothetical protein H6558_18390 [Lewinellaceae bacterium]|nr:hypothetical protein [Lewinellaceae bacterium]